MLYFSTFSYLESTMKLFATLFVIVDSIRLTTRSKSSSQSIWEILQANQNEVLRRTNCDGTTETFCVVEFDLPPDVVDALRALGKNVWHQLATHSFPMTVQSAATSLADSSENQLVKHIIFRDPKCTRIVVIVMHFNPRSISGYNWVSNLPRKLPIISIENDYFEIIENEKVPKLDKIPHLSLEVSECDGHGPIRLGRVYYRGMSSGEYHRMGDQGYDSERD